MGRDDEREPELALERVDQVEHALAGVGVEMPGRLVAEEQLRLLGERARDRDALRLAAGQLGRQVVELRAETDQLEQRRGASRRVGLAAASRAAKATFSNAVKCGSRFAPWKT